MEAPGASGAPPSRPRPQRLLVVDDEEDIRESLKALFETCLDDVEVRTAASGAEGLEALAREHFDLIVTDYKMPGMTGLEFLTRAAKEGPAIPRILVTAFPDLEIAIRAINEANIENFFTKPLDADSVLKSVRAVLQEQRAQEMRAKTFARSIDLMRRQLDKKD